MAGSFHRHALSASHTRKGRRTLPNTNKDNGPVWDGFATPPGIHITSWKYTAVGKGYIRGGWHVPSDWVAGTDVEIRFRMSVRDWDGGWPPSAGSTPNAVFKRWVHASGSGDPAAAGESWNLISGTAASLPLSGCALVDEVLYTVAGSDISDNDMITFAAQASGISTCERVFILEVYSKWTLEH